MKGETSPGSRGSTPRQDGSCPVSLENPYKVRTARPADRRHLSRLVQLLADEFEAGRLARPVHHEWLTESLRDRRAVLAFRGELVVGVCAAESWQEDQFAGHMPVVVAAGFRGRGLQLRLFRATIRLVRRRWPKAALMTLTLSSDEEELSQRAGMDAVPYCDLSADPAFWNNCDGCPHQGHLKRNQYQDCHCWAGVLLPRGVQPNRVIPKDALRRDDEPTLS